MPRLAGLLCLAAGAAIADPGYYVVTPYANEGLRLIDFRYWTVKPNNRSEVVWPEVGLGYGVNSRWTTELFVSWEGSRQEAVRPQTLNWQNDLLLTQGEWPFDLALHAQFIKDREVPHESVVEWGPVLQTDLGRTQLNLNLFFERTFGAEVPQASQLKYQWQLRYRWIPPLHVGLQGFGELGDWDRWAPSAKQSHRAGPALFSNLPLNDHQTAKFQAAWLVGRTYTQRGHMFTFKAHLEF